MAISRFVDELGTDLNRYQVQEEGGTSYYVKLLRSANVTQVGTSLNAENMNKIVDAINNISFSVSGNTLTIRNQDNVTITFAPKYTKVDVGLGNVDNTSDLNKPISTAAKNALDKKADLDGSGKILLSQIPDTGLTADVAKKVMYKEEAKSIEEIFEDEIFDEVEQTVECDHEYEITGNTGDEHGLAVKDQQVVIEKIQGQTRRYSENLLNIPNKEEVWHGVTISIKDGVIKLNGTCDINIDYYIYGEYRLNGSYTLTNNFSGTSSNQLYPSISVVNTESINHLVCRPNSPISKKVINDLVQFKLYFTSGLEMNNVIIKPMLVEGTHTEDTMPVFQPYDNTLVNSKCNLISTNKNLCKELIFNNANRYNDSHYLDKNILKPNKTYTMKFKTKNTGAEIYRAEEMTDAWISFTCDGEEKTYTFTTKNVLKIINNKIQLFKNSSDNSGMLDSDTIYDFMLVYGSTAPTEYIPYEQDIFNFNVELGEFDTFDNIANKITRQTSPIRTLNGTENWVFNTQNENYVEFYCELSYLSDIEDFSGLNTITNFTSQTTNDRIAIGFSKVYFRVPISKTSITGTTVEEWKAYLQANPVSFAYKLATPTTEEYVAPNGYQVWEGGLQQQKIEGKYLPYVITKKYSVSIGAQLDANRSIDRGQQEQIDEVKQAFRNLGYDGDGIIADRVYLDVDGQTVEESISTIYTRLNELGFKEGTFDVSGLSSPTIITNTISKQGKRVLATLSITMPVQSLSNLDISFNPMFEPNNTTSIIIGVQTLTGNLFYMCNVQDRIITSPLSGITNAIAIYIMNVGWEI